MNGKENEPKEWICACSQCGADVIDLKVGISGITVTAICPQCGNEEENFISWAQALGFKNKKKGKNGRGPNRGAEK